MEKLGIVGGLGPAATVRLMGRIVEFTAVSRDQDHLDITVFNRPSTPDRTAYLLGVEGAPSFVPFMQESARTLEELGCTVLCTPCNTAHSRLEEIASVLTRARFVHMLNETVAFAASLGCKRVGMLATDGTKAAGVYQAALEAAGMQAVWGDDAHQAEVMSIIYDDVKAGRPSDPARIRRACEHLAAKGCDGIVLGCTELSLLGCGTSMAGVPTIDALDVLAWRCVQECGAPAHDLRALFAQDAAE